MTGDRALPPASEVVIRTGCSSTALEGLRILVVEDDYLQADDLSRALAAAGAIVVGPTARADEAESLIRETEVDAAVLDIGLADGPCFALAEQLLRLNLPFLFATGYGCTSIPLLLRGIPLLEKPFRQEMLVAGLAALVLRDKSAAAAGV